MVPLDLLFRINRDGILKGDKMAKSEYEATEKTNPASAATSITEEQIAKVAYSLFEARGGEHGHDLEDWFEAERSLQSGRPPQ
jgi:hypothetical protein